KNIRPHHRARPTTSALHLRPPSKEMPVTAPRRLPFALSVLVTAGGVLLVSTAAAAPPTAPPRPAAHGACDPIDPTACLLPFPNDYFTVPDPSSPTGRRVRLAATSMPTTVGGVPIDPTE